MTEEKAKKVFTAFEIVSAVAAVFCAAFLAVTVLGLGIIIFLKENLSVEAGGILGFFIDVAQEGQTRISSSDLALSALPRAVSALIFSVFCLKAKSLCKKGKEAGSLFFADAGKKVRSLSVSAFLIALFSSILTRVAQSVVSNEFFNLTQSDNVGWVTLGLVLLFFSFFFDKENGKNNNQTTEEM